MPGTLKMSVLAAANAKPNAAWTWIRNTFQVSPRACANCSPIIPLGASISLPNTPVKSANSGRVGRSAGAKSLDDKFIPLAVVAHIRHAETKYDELLSRGMERRDARDEVADDIDIVLERWKSHTKGWG